jgi:UDP-N-acetylglucosamine 1-carboxyvinyltransferase
MQKLVVQGGQKLTGKITLSGSKNIATKVLIASLLTDDEVVIHNVPKISDFEILLEIIQDMGASCTYENHTLTVHAGTLVDYEIPLESGMRIRPSSMLIAPLLARLKKALIPNPGGCRIGARPIDRTTEGLMKMGATIRYESEDGYFHCNTDGLVGTTYRFDKNTHTGTETLLIAAVLAKGTTVLENAAEEPEVDELIAFLTKMGAHIKRVGRTITIEGVEKLHGTTFSIASDRNEAVTFAVAAYMTGGDITVIGARKKDLTAFLEKLDEIGAKWEEVKGGLRFMATDAIVAADIVTTQHPGFMTDWQAPWAVLMTQAQGASIIHETVYENRFGYASELVKMGAQIELFNPKVENPKELYNFNIDDDKKELKHAVKIIGPAKLHNAVV